jgi:putative ABC transport system substrate-binding protein
MHPASPPFFSVLVPSLALTEAFESSRVLEISGQGEIFIKLRGRLTEEERKNLGSNLMEIWRRRGLQFGLGLGLFLLALLCGCQKPFSQPPLVGIILWNQDIQSFEDSLQGVIEGLREEGYLDGLNLRLQVINSTGDRARAATAAAKFLRQGAKLLITLGTVPTLVALDVTQGSHLPIVYSGVGAPAATGLDDPLFTESRLTGTSMEVPVGEQLRLFMLARPRLQRLGILFCTATPVAVATGRAAEAAARGMGLKVVLVTVTDERPELLDKALKNLEDEGVQALFLPTDPVLAAPRNLDIICARLLRDRLPVMVPFASSVTHGALISYHADSAEVGRQAGRILSGATLKDVPPEIPKVKRLTLNLRVARSLELPLSRHLLSRACDLY